MKPILEKQNKDVILIDKITTNHIIVGLNKYNDPVILTNGIYDSNDFAFSPINNEFTNRNAYNHYNSIQEAIKHSFQDFWKIEVFHQKDWKKALQWLIDNAE